MSLWRRFCKKLAWAGYTCSLAVCLSAMFRPEHGIWAGFYVLHFGVFIPFLTSLRALSEMNGSSHVWLGTVTIRQPKKLLRCLPSGLKRFFVGNAFVAVLLVGSDVYRDLVLKTARSSFHGPSSLPIEWKTWVTPVSPDDFLSYGAFAAVFFLLSICILTIRETWPQAQK